MLHWLIVVIAIAGAVLNIRKHRAGFALWCISNSYWFFHNIRAGEYEQATVFSVFFVLSIIGLWRWSRRPAKPDFDRLQKDIRIATICIGFLTEQVDKNKELLAEVRIFCERVSRLRTNVKNQKIKVRVNRLFTEATRLAEKLKKAKQ